MTLISYQVFITVVEQRSFNKAAELLSLTPSAVSHTITSMEKELGYSLFTRSKEGVFLTNYGKGLLPYIQTVIQSDESLIQAVSQLNGLHKGTVKLGVFNSVCTNWIPKLVKAFHKKYPNIIIQIYQGTYEDILKWLKIGSIDIGFLSVSSADTFTVTPLYDDQLVCVVPKGFKTIHQDYITIDELKEQRFVFQRESCDADIQNFLNKYHLNVQSNCYVVDDLSTIAMVMGGFGICIMPKLVMTGMTHSVDIYRINPNEYRTIGVTVANPKRIAPAVKALFEFIVKSTEVYL
jgi:DNA-binding transcriptional LysR family regulator